MGDHDASDRASHGASRDTNRDTMSVEAVVSRLGITARTLRYYEEMGLITPVARTAGGHRLYNEGTIARLEQILRLKTNLGFSLQEIRAILQAEQNLESLQASIRQSKSEGEPQMDLVDQYIDVLRDLVQTLDAKIESVERMRNNYQDQLARSIEFRDRVQKK